jgi:signal peptidase I
LPAAPRKGRAAKARPLSQSGSTKPGWRGGALWRNVRAIALPLALFLLIRTFLLEAYRIPSGSMIPSLLVGDWLFVNKLRYGPHIPFTDDRLPGYAEPRRGDVVVFVSPPQVDQPHDLTPTLVKRAVAVGSDTIHMRRGVLYVNGIAQRQGYGVSTDAFDSVDELFDWQKPLGLEASRFGAAPAQPSHDEWGPLVVPPGHLFMMGDNRYNSKDSRYWGFVPRDNVRGRPMFVYYSYNADDSDRPLPFITDIRWGRLGHWIR